MRRFIIIVFLTLGLLILATASPTVRPTLANHVVPTCTFDIDTGSDSFAYMQTYEALDWKKVYGRSLELAGLNKLLPGVKTFKLPKLQTGPRSAGSDNRVKPYTPPTLLKAICLDRERLGLKPATIPKSPTEAWGRSSFPPSCAYGIMQVLSGMLKHRRCSQPGSGDDWRPLRLQHRSRRSDPGYEVERCP